MPSFKAIGLTVFLEAKSNRYGGRTIIIIIITRLVLVLKYDCKQKTHLSCVFDTTITFADHENLCTAF